MNRFLMSVSVAMTAACGGEALDAAAAGAIVPTAAAFDAGGIGDDLGAALAVDGLTAAAGSPATSRVRIYADSPTHGWGLEQEVVPPESDANIAGFGRSLALAGERLYVGAVGKVFVYSRGESGFQHALTLSGNAAEDFGATIAASASHVVVGAPARQGGSGMLLFYRTTNFKAFQARYGATGERLGAALAMGQDEQGLDLLAVGCPGFDGNKGRALAIRTNQFGYFAVVTELRHPSAAAGDEMGRAVAIAANKLAVGIPGRNLGVGNDGAVLLFKRSETNAWLRAIELTTDIGGGLRFGEAVAVRSRSDDFDVLVGAPNHSTASGGAVFFFEVNFGEVQEPAIVTAPLGENARFGAALAYSDDIVWFGAPGATDADGNTTGAVCTTKF